jgi:hypothetical protein
MTNINKDKSYKEVIMKDTFFKKAGKAQDTKSVKRLPLKKDKTNSKQIANEFSKAILDIIFDEKMKSQLEKKHSYIKFI